MCYFVTTYANRQCMGYTTSLFGVCGGSRLGHAIRNLAATANKVYIPRSVLRTWELALVQPFWQGHTIPPPTVPHSRPAQTHTSQYDNLLQARALASVYVDRATDVAGSGGRATHLVAWREMLFADGSLSFLSNSRSGGGVRRHVRLVKRAPPH